MHPCFCGYQLLESEKYLIEIAKELELAQCNLDAVLITRKDLILI
jgi:hypothetical protein